MKDGRFIPLLSIMALLLMASVVCIWKLPDGSLKEGKHHGGTGGTEKRIVLADSEFVAGISGKAGAVVDSITIDTNFQSYGPFGGNGGEPYNLEGDVVGFYGRSGTRLDAIGIQDSLFLYDRQYFGGSNGIPFIENVTDMKRLTKITIRSDAYIDTLQMEWINEKGERIIGVEHGGHAIQGGTLKQVILKDGEFLTKITGRSGNYLDNICFHTNLSVYSFGGTGGTPFEIDLAHSKVLCFIGRYGRFIDGFGVLYKRNHS